MVAILLCFIGIWHFKIRVLRITIYHVKIMIQKFMFTISHDSDHSNHICCNYNVMQTYVCTISLPVISNIILL